MTTWPTDHYFLNELTLSFFKEGVNVCRRIELFIDVHTDLTQ